MQLKLIIMIAAFAKKGVIMEINNKKNQLSHIRFTFIMLLFVMCLAMHVFFCSNNLYELLDKAVVIETWTISENIVANEGGNLTTDQKPSLLNKDNFYNKTITKNIHSIRMIAAIPKGISLLLFLIIVFLIFYFTLFILLPDGWTLINQKVRLNN